MPDDELLASLAPWQARLFGAACASRLAALVDAFGSVRERRAFHAGVDALWNTCGAMPEELAAALLRRIQALVDTENPSLGAEFLIVVSYALRADAGRAADQASERWEYVGEHLDGGWARREAAYQRTDLAMLAGKPTNPANLTSPAGPIDPRRVTELLHRPFRDAAELDAALPALADALGETLNPAGPLPPEPPPRARHVGCSHPQPAPRSPAAARPDAALDAALIGAVLIAPGDTCPIGPTGLPAPPFRAGDVLTVTAEFVPHVVVGVSEYDVVVQPLAGGRRAEFARAGVPPRWTPYSLRPAPDDLWVGDRCQVGIPPTNGYVLRTQGAGLHLLPFGHTASGGLADEAVGVEPYTTPPGVEVVLCHRAYPFLVPGDVLSDAAGQVLIFQPPFLFTSPTGEGGRVPRWPLTLVERQWTPALAPEPVIATRHGCHDEVLDRWEAETGATLPVDADHESWFCWPADR